MAQPTAWDADCVAIRCALNINVAERTFKGRASVWVRAPRSSSLKLHCRGVTITNVEVNGIKTRWRLRDPVAEVATTKIQGAGALEAAAWLSAAEEACKSGELEIEVPAKVHLETLPEHDGCDDDFSRKARRNCATRLPSMSNIERDDRLVVIEYEGSDGLDFTANSCLTRSRRGAAPDINGTRCWCPCVDRCDVAHAWRLEITTDLGVACSGVRRPDVDGAHCYEVRGRARSIGFVVGRFAAKERAVRVASVKAALETGRPKLTRVDTDTPSHYRSLGGDAMMRHDSVEIMRDDPIGQTPEIPSRPSLDRVPTSEQTPDWIPPTPGRAVSRTIAGDEASLFVYDERNDVLDARREKARARAVSSALEACGDATQFYRAFLKCSGKGHSVVLLDDVPSGTCASFANLTVLKRSLACGLDRVDIGGVGDAVLLALFESLALQLSADDDCTLANAVPWYILLKYIERSRGRDSCSALTKFMRDDLNASKDPVNAGCVGALALRELDASQGRGVVRDSLRRIASSESWSRDTLQASFTGDVDQSFRSLVQNDLSKSVQIGYTYDPQKHLVVCELVGDKHFRGPLSVRVVEAESGWDYEKAVEASKHRWEFGCRSSGGAYASLRQKHGRHHHIAAKALTDDDRKRVQAYDESTKFQRPKVPEGARRRPWRAKRDEPERATDAAEFAQRAVDREEKRKRKRGDKEDSSSSSSSSSESESDDDRPRKNAVEQEDVLRGARAAKTDPILYVSADPEKARFRSITVAQSCKAWVERLLGSDDAASQLESVDALISTVHGEVEDRLLAARALACAARGSSKRRDASIETRTASIAALAAWQRLEIIRASQEQTPPSAFGDAQLRVAFDERYRKNGKAFPHGGLRAPSFLRSDAKAGDALALKTALVAALGDARPHRAKRRARGADDALLRVVELLRHQHDLVGDDAALPSDVFVAHALSALASCCKTSGSAKDLEKAKLQCERYLRWDLRHKTSVNSCVAAAALHALCHVSKALCRRAMVVPEIQGERDSSDEGEQEEPAKAQQRLRAAAQKEAVLLPRSYASAEYPRAVRATAIRLALDLASEVRGQLPAALQWALTTLEKEETYVRRIGAQALVAVLRGEDAVYLRARPGTALGVPCGLDLDEPLLGRPRVRADPHTVKGDPTSMPKLLQAVDDALAQRPALFDSVWRRSLLDVRFALGVPQDALTAKEKLPAELGVHVDAVAALDKRRFAREAPVCLVTKSTAPKFKFTVKRRSQPSLSPGVSPGAA